MKVLIGYDGSPCADATIVELARAGLPSDTQIKVLTVADVYLPPNDTAAEQSHANARSRELAEQAIATAQDQAADAADRIRSMGRRWDVTAETVADTPAWGLVKLADQWEPELVMVGSQGKSLLRRLALGSVSATVLEHAACSVRVARDVPHDRDPLPPGSPVELLIGIDGSIGSATAVEAVSLRHWPAGSEVRVVFVLDLRTVTSVLSTTASGDVRKYAEDIAEGACEDLRAAGLIASPIVVEGNVREILPLEAERWGADCIFVGAKGQSMIQRFLLGSVSATVAARGACSVEVVRFPAS